MRRALELALRGRGRVEPNPLVGAVCVREGRIVGEGWHGQYGGDHAEVHALRQAGDAASGSTLYVTLEPCAHQGKTPPCIDAVVTASVSRLVFALRDPNPTAAGGAAALRERGVEVRGGVLSRDALSQNLPFVKRARLGLPAVRIKWAMSADGRIATSTGDSRWISSDESRRHAHRGRARVDAIVVGIDTALRDDPELTARLAGHVVRGAVGRPALRVVLDSGARLPVTAKLLQTLALAPLLVAVGDGADPTKVEALRAAGAEVAILPRGADGRVSLRLLLEALAKRGGESPDAELRDDPTVPWPVSRVLVEGGGEVHASCIEAGLVDEATIYLAPIIIGGRGARSPIEGLGRENVRDAVRLSGMRVRRLGPDLVVEGRISNPALTTDLARNAEPGGARSDQASSAATASASGEGAADPHAPGGADLSGADLSAGEAGPATDSSDPSSAALDLEDAVIQCVSCPNTFVHTKEAQAYYREKGFESAPKRCLECRRKRREGRAANARDSGRHRKRPSGRQPAARTDSQAPEAQGARRSERRPSSRLKAPTERWDVTCHACGTETQVPFKPDADRPVYCRDCYRSRKR